MFGYGANDFDRNGCQNGLCKCQCFDDVINENCVLADDNEYWFFEFTKKFNNDGK